MYFSKIFTLLYDLLGWLAIYFSLLFQKMSTRLVNKNYFPTIQTSLGTFLEKKSTDCILYGEDGSRFEIHKVSIHIYSALMVYLVSVGQPNMLQSKLLIGTWRDHSPQLRTAQYTVHSKTRAIYLSKI